MFEGVGGWGSHVRTVVSLHRATWNARRRDLDPGPDPAPNPLKQTPSPYIIP